MIIDDIWENFKLWLQFDFFLLVNCKMKLNT